MPFVKLAYWNFGFIKEAGMLMKSRDIFLSKYMKFIIATRI